MAKKKQTQKKKNFGIILAIILIAYAAINLIPPQKNVENNPFIVGKSKLPMIAAHRGGGDNNPENTMLAFREAVNTIGVQIIESDLYLTKDGYLVYNHDSYIDETCNINGDISLDEVEDLCDNKENRHYIKDMTLEELQQYNFGYYFEDKNGQRIYKDATDLEGMGLQIATVDQLFEEFYETNPDLMFIVEIKNSGDTGIEACRILYETLKKYPGYMDQIVIGTFHDEIEVHNCGELGNANTSNDTSRTNRTRPDTNLYNVRPRFNQRFRCRRSCYVSCNKRNVGEFCTYFFHTL